MSTRRPRRIRRLSWQEHVIAKARFLEHECNRLREGCRQQDLPITKTVEEAIAKHLQAARHAADAASDGQTANRPFVTERLHNAWSGVQTEKAYVNLHLAEVELAALYSEEDIKARIPDVLTRLRTCLPPTDQRRIRAEALFGGDVDGASRSSHVSNNNSRRSARVLPKKSGELDHTLDTFAVRRAALRDFMQVGYDVSDQLHLRLRNFRNVLIATAVLLLALVTSVCIVGVVWPRAIPLCFQPSNTVAGPQPATSEPTENLVCPSSTGKSTPHGGDVPVVALMGLLGGALSGSFTIQKLRATTQYTIPVVLSFLKFPAGALTAIIGLVLIHGEFIPGLSELDSQGQILAYAVVFGVAQQFFTKFVDEKAQDVLRSAPTKEDRPTRSEPVHSPRHDTTPASAQRSSGRAP